MNERIELTITKWEINRTIDLGLIMAVVLNITNDDKLLKAVCINIQYPLTGIVSVNNRNLHR